MKKMSKMRGGKRDKALHMILLRLHLRKSSPNNQPTHRVRNKRNAVVLPAFIIADEKLHLCCQSFAHVMEIILGFVFVEFAVQNYQPRVEVSQGEL